MPCTRGQARSRKSSSNQAHREGRPVNTWTVNAPVEMRRVIDLGVDGIITDRPDVLAAMLRGEEVAGDVPPPPT